MVDTANRLQGREFDVVLALHPLSGRTDASAFHLDAGRLCVLASRHRQCCVFVGRLAPLDCSTTIHRPVMLSCGCAEIRSSTAGKPMRGSWNTWRPCAWYAAEGEDAW